MRTPSDCISCTPGYYCSGSSSPAPTGQCSAGSYCTGGSTTPTQYPATPGYYTILGSSQQIKCTAGTYSNSNSATACLPCGSGTYCNAYGMTAGLPCLAGNYCPSGAINPSPCALGTFNPTAATTTAGACGACTGGKYCGLTGLTVESGSCAAGYFCYSGSSSATPIANLTSLGTTYLVTTSGLCPQGYYCPAGTQIPIACGIGYYLNYEGASQLSQCIQCRAGSYCSQTGLVSPSGSCSAGYYCPESSTAAT